MEMKTQGCVVGGGPAGMMLGLLLARAGVDVWVLEKHADFLRDFRGDTVHPSTLEVMHELGLLKEFLKRPHQEVQRLRGWVGDFEITVADFSHLPTVCKFIVLMPQWDFLNFLAEEAKRYPTFHLRMQTEVTGLIEEKGRITGVTAQTPDGPVSVRSPLVIAADGRNSLIRERAGLAVQALTAPIDVLWMRLSRKAGDPSTTFGRFDRGKIFANLNRDAYWQCAYVIPKGGYEDIKSRGLEALRTDIVELMPFFKDRVQELSDWEQVKLLAVRVDRLKRWYREGLLCIGDAAHAMSPAGGVGINLAIQDAVAAANRLIKPLLAGSVTVEDLRAIQQRRTFPTVMTQRLQTFIHNQVLGRSLRAAKLKRLPWPLRLVEKWPVLTRIPARIVGVGFRPEHLQS